jgi:hypothetical protein
VIPSSVSRSISSNGALRTVAALVLSGNYIGTSTADVRTPLIVRSGNRVVLVLGMLETNYYIVFLLAEMLIFERPRRLVFEERS